MKPLKFRQKVSFILRRNNYFIIVLLAALVIKLALFSYAEVYAPEAKFQHDTKLYLKLSQNLVTHRIFSRMGQDGEYMGGNYFYEVFRTPGFPFFLGVLHGLARIPLSGIILIQIFLTILVALITYKTAIKIDPRLGYLSAVIILLDPSITIFSLMLLSETLFLLFISLFMYMFTLYLKEKRSKFIVFAAFFLVLATYVRPISYLLGIGMSIFMIYFIFRIGPKRLIMHALVFLITIYSLLGIWQVRNKQLEGINTFSTISQFSSIYKENERDEDKFIESLPPSLYHLNAASRCIMSLMARPGTLKAFKSETLKRIEKIVAYPWIVFWLVGFIVGVSRIERSYYLQFLAFVVLYFICASVGGILYGVSSRMRVPMMPFIAIISSCGWLRIRSSLKTREKEKTKRSLKKEQEGDYMLSEKKQNIQFWIIVSSVILITVKAFTISGRYDRLIEGLDKRVDKIIEEYKVEVSTLEGEMDIAGEAVQSNKDNIETFEAKLSIFARDFQAKLDDKAKELKMELDSKIKDLEAESDSSLKDLKAELDSNVENPEVELSNKIKELKRDTKNHKYKSFSGEAVLK